MNFLYLTDVNTTYSKYCFYAGQLCKEWDTVGMRERDRTSKSTMTLKQRKERTKKFLFEFLKQKNSRIKNNTKPYSIFTLLKADWVNEFPDEPKTQNTIVPLIKEYLQLKNQQDVTI
jgi:hypothetical protein